MGALVRFDQALFNQFNSNFEVELSQRRNDAYRDEGFFRDTHTDGLRPRLNVGRGHRRAEAAQRWLRIRDKVRPRGFVVQR